MKKLAILCVVLLLGTAAMAQESNNGKRLWADSWLNKPAPEFFVEQWLTKQPDMKGKFVLIDFWATWCGPCRGAIKHLNEFHEKFGDRMVVVGISAETPDQVAALKDPVIKYYSAIDQKKTMHGKLNVQGIPHVILIDPKGIVRWEGFPTLAGHELTEEILKGLLEKYK